MDDSGLASEMIQLLRDELERIRAQIREGQSIRKEEQVSLIVQSFEEYSNADLNGPLAGF